MTDSTNTLLTLTSYGLYCAAGDFYIDPWRPVHRAVVTHAHADHARHGSEHYLACTAGEPVLRTRLGRSASLQLLPYGETVTINGVQVSLHPAGHLLGSAQVRVELNGEVWVVSGDYKTDNDPTCAPFELVRCHTFITESTFGLPIYRWPPPEQVFAEINAWWRANQAEGRASLLYGYALGKAQRLLAGVDASIGPIYTHGAVEQLNRDYRAAGVSLPKTTYVGHLPKITAWDQALIVAPPSAHATPWTRRFGTLSSGLASGWMRIRGARRRRAVDRGFVLSDHVDWPELMRVIHATGAERVWVTHGYQAVVVRWLQEQGLDAAILETRFTGEQVDEVEDEQVVETRDDTP